MNIIPVRHQHQPRHINQKYTDDKIKQCFNSIVNFVTWKPEEYKAVHPVFNEIHCRLRFFTKWCLHNHLFCSRKSWSVMEPSKKGSQTVRYHLQCCLPPLLGDNRNLVPSYSGNPRWCSTRWASDTCAALWANTVHTRDFLHFHFSYSWDFLKEKQLHSLFPMSNKKDGHILLQSYRQGYAHALTTSTRRELLQAPPLQTSDHVYAVAEGFLQRNPGLKALWYVQHSTCLLSFTDTRISNYSMYSGLLVRISRYINARKC